MTIPQLQDHNNTSTLTLFLIILPSNWNSPCVSQFFFLPLFSSLATLTHDFYERGREQGLDREAGESLAEHQRKLASKVKRSKRWTSKFKSLKIFKMQPIGKNRNSSGKRTNSRNVSRRRVVVAEDMVDEEVMEAMGVEEVVVDESKLSVLVHLSGKYRRVVSWFHVN